MLHGYTDLPLCTISSPFVGVVSARASINIVFGFGIVTCTIDEVFITVGIFTKISSIGELTSYHRSIMPVELHSITMRTIVASTWELYFDEDKLEILDGAMDMLIKVFIFEDTSEDVFPIGSSFNLSTVMAVSFSFTVFSVDA